MAFSDDYTLSQDGTFRGRVTMALVGAALAISSEARNAYPPPAESKRQVLASAVLRDSTLLITPFVHAAISAGKLTSLNTDADISNAIAACFNGIAGVNATDLI